MKISQDKPREFESGYNEIISKEEHQDILMDFGILKLNKDQVEVNSEDLERIYLIIKGDVLLSWNDQEAKIERPTFTDDGPWALHVPPKLEVKLTGVSDETEISVHKTENEKTFGAKLYTPEDCVIEKRGKGTMNGTGTRIVRTILDKSLAPENSKFMLGEDVHYPGKWAGFPSHYHPQPEIYFYKFEPENGFGLLKLGDEGVLLEQNDTVKIVPNLSHPQVAAPGYAMYFIWIIRHLDDNPYIEPIYEPEHEWVTSDDAKIWPEK